MQRLTATPFRIGLAVLLLWAAGCPSSPSTSTDVRAVHPAPTSVAIAPRAIRPTAPTVHLPPLLLHLPGVGGTRTLDDAMVTGFYQAGFRGDEQIYDWTGGDEGLHALRNIDRNHRQAKLIADIIIARHDADPSCKIYLTSHSGGAGLAVWALEDLPPSVQVQSLLFMSPALSPKYDLTNALRHVAGNAYAFTSESDSFVLGLGTRTFGTMDGVQTDAAGKVGFAQPTQADPVEYAKLFQFPYQPAWTQYDDRGDHVGGMTRRFARHVLAPLLLSGIPPANPPPKPSQPTTATTLPVIGTGR